MTQRMTAAEYRAMIQAKAPGMAQDPRSIPGEGTGEDALRFFVEGLPRAQGNKRSKLHAGRILLYEYRSKDLSTWREAIGCSARNAGARPRSGPICLRLEFLLEPCFLFGQHAQPDVWKKPYQDLDKLARACLDALTSRAYCDDVQVVELTLSKRSLRPGEKPGVWIELLPVQET